MQQKDSRLSWCYFQPHWWNLQAILETKQQCYLHKYKMKQSTKHNQTTTKNNRTTSVHQPL